MEVSAVTMDRKARKAAYNKAYSAKHVEEIRAKKAAYYTANPERYNEPKRRAKFDQIESNRKENCEKKGLSFVPREYVVLKTRPLTDEEYIEMYHSPRPKAVVIPEPVLIDTPNAEHLDKKKAYREANRVEILAKKKAYREANKVEIALKKKAYITKKKAENAKEN